MGDMIVCITLKSSDQYYTQSDSIDSTITALKSQLPIECWWYTAYGKKYTERIIFYDEELIVMVRSESDASPIEEL